MRPPDFILPGYLHRWHLFAWAKRWPNVYLHHILAPDPGEDLHDHPAWSISIVLRGWYEEEFEPDFDGVTPYRRSRAGSVRFRPADEPHRITEVSSGGCWTIWIRGGHRRVWGFWTSRDQWVPWYEHEGRGE